MKQLVFTIGLLALLAVNTLAQKSDFPVLHIHPV
jgi:hypothetical protein